MALSPKVFGGVALVAAVAAAGIIVANNGGGGAPTPTPTPVARRTAAPVATPVDASKLPAAYRADAAMLPANVASNLVFIEDMLNGKYRSTMDQVTCHCCNKSLAQCYSDTATKADKACSPLCSVCQHEGKDVIAGVNAGMPVDEIRDALARAYGSSGGSHGEGDGHNHAHPM